jgi:hypothetical protein
VPHALPAGALDDTLLLSKSSGPIGEAAQKLAALLSIRATIREQVMQALDDTVHRYGEERGGDTGLTLLPLAAKDPTAATAADWLRSAGAA